MNRLVDIFHRYFEGNLKENTSTSTLKSVPYFNDIVRG